MNERERKELSEISEELAITVDEVFPEAEALEALISGGKYREFRDTVSEIPPEDFAEIFSEFDEKNLAKGFRTLAKDYAAELFVELAHDMQEHIINSFTDKELSDVLSELYFDDTVDIIEEMPAGVVKRILRASTPEARGAINKLLRYPKDSAGSIMTTEYVRFTPDMTVEAALAHIRSVAIDKETIYTCYVTDKNRRLVGIVTAKQLLISPLLLELSEIMEDNVIYVSTGDDKEEVAMKFDKYGFLALPVVDAELRLVGIVTLDDAIGVIKEEAEEDFARIAGVTPNEKPYLKTSPWALFRARSPWLLLLMVTATFSSLLLTAFESALPATTVLLLFVPMLMGTGGNSGGQASVTVTRAISLGEISPKSLPRVILKELSVGLMTGLALGVAAFVKIVLIDKLLFGNDDITLVVAAVVALSLTLTVIAAKLIGGALPLFAKCVHLDPAVMASPIITTLLDVLSLAVYFVIASLILS